MKRSNVAIFVPHAGCPNRCSFCDQRLISGSVSVPDGDYVRACCETALKTMKNAAESEIAFFGGSFTAIDRDIMLSLLRAAAPYIKSRAFHGIRISTRPDCINSEILDILQEYGVTAIELGAQSLDDEVLRLNRRGHTAEAVENACALIKERGIETGLQLMTGLYGSTREAELESARRVISMKPDTARIYPVAVLSGTMLERLWRSGEYVLRDFDDILDVCAQMLLSFHKAGITVLRCGLHASDDVSANAVAGYYHPAFGELARGCVYRGLLEELAHEGEINALVAKGCTSMALGHKRANVGYFAAKGITLRVREDESLGIFEVRGI